MSVDREPVAEQPKVAFGIRLKLLGTFSLTGHNGEPIELPSGKLQALLAYLALNPDQRHLRAKLANLLWGRHDDEHARNNLSQSLYRLRRVLAPCTNHIIEADKESVALKAEAIAVDVLDVRRLARIGSPAALRQAAELCAEGLLESFEIKEDDFSDWLAREREVMTRLENDILTNLAEFQIDAGETENAIVTAARLAARDPLNEEAHRLLMRANMGAGRRHAALQQYRRCTEVLRREIGAEPEIATKALYEEIRGGQKLTTIWPQMEIGAIARVPDKHDPENVGRRQLLDWPSIAVLPFKNLLSDSADVDFAHEMTEDLVILLSHCRAFFTVAPNLDFPATCQDFDVTQFARDLGVRYLVEGSVANFGDRVRIAAQLIDGTNGNHLWADRLEGTLDDIFDLQEQIANEIAVVVEPRTNRLLGGTKLKHGAHESRTSGMCAMELVSYIAGEEHSYAPKCASDLLTGFTIRLNDSMGVAERENLKSLLPRLVGTNDGNERQRFEAMTRMMVARLLVPNLERQGVPLLAARLQQRALASLGSFAQWLHGLDNESTDLRLKAVIPRDIRRALLNAVNAAARLCDGSQPNWNWCGGELGIAVTDTIRRSGDIDWTAALQVLEAGIDAAPVGRSGVGWGLNDRSELNRAVNYVHI